MDFYQSSRKEHCLTAVTLLCLSALGKINIEEQGLFSIVFHEICYMMSEMQRPGAPGLQLRLNVAGTKKYLQSYQS